jgi:putative phosphoribosyl transferase
MKKEIILQLQGIDLTGNLNIPNGAKSIVIFSHGSGSSRFSPRNNYVAEILNKNNIATLLIDLLSAEEDNVYENRFNIDLLTQRLLAVTQEIQKLPEFQQFRFGYFGASTGAASALKAAAKLNRQISAVVSRGGRPDLAGTVLQFVTAPVLLIVGSNDREVLELNREAYRQLNGVKELIVVSGATHLFEEAGKLEEVAEHACKWFEKYLSSHSQTIQ